MQQWAPEIGWWPLSLLFTCSPQVLALTFSGVCAMVGSRSPKENVLPEHAYGKDLFSLTPHTGTPRYFPSTLHASGHCFPSHFLQHFAGFGVTGDITLLSLLYFETVYLWTVLLNVFQQYVAPGDWHSVAVSFFPFAVPYVIQSFLLAQYLYSVCPLLLCCLTFGHMHWHTDEYHQFAICSRLLVLCFPPLVCFSCFWPYVLTCSLNLGTFAIRWYFHFPKLGTQLKSLNFAAHLWCSL